MKKLVCQSILRGRPFGGVATLVNNKYFSKIKCLRCSDRFVILILHRTILVNVYLPCSSVNNYVNIISDMLSEISTVLDDFQDCSIIFGGDLNLDLHDSSFCTQLILKFCSDYKLNICNDI